LSRKERVDLPGPGLCIPLLGHYKLFLQGSDNIKGIWNLYKQYSKQGVMLLNVFSMNNVIVGDFNVLKELFNNPDVANRGHVDFRKCNFIQKFNEDRGDPPGPLTGVIFSQGRTWVEQRRFTLKTLRDFGFGKSSMEETIHDEIRHFIFYLKNYTNTPVDIARKFNLPILNALWKIMVGESFEYTDPKLEKLLNDLGEFARRFGSPSTVLVLNYPWLFKIFPTLLNRNKDIEFMREIMLMMNNCIEQHKLTLDVNSPKDVIDTMLIEIQNTKDETSSFYQNKGYNNLVNTMLELFVAGSETTSTTLTWAVLYMIREPEIQSRVQAELDKVVGTSRLPSLSDRSQLPYTEAVLMEIQRCGNIVPMGVQHMASRSIQINGVTIPANTMISPCMSEIMKGDYWGDGLVFRPERFLDESGKLKSEERLIPFSIGKRRCLGETLAKTEYFLFFTALLQQFSFMPEISGTVPPETYVPGASILPIPFKTIVKPRY